MAVRVGDEETEERLTADILTAQVIGFKPVGNWA
jgi:hypothetical protein